MCGIKFCVMVFVVLFKIKEGEIDDYKGFVEFVSFLEGFKVGEKVFFEGWNGIFEVVLNFKKKVWEIFQFGFMIIDGFEVVFDVGVVEVLGKFGLGKFVIESGGVCIVKFLKDVVV